MPLYRSILPYDRPVQHRRCIPRHVCRDRVSQTYRSISGDIGSRESTVSPEIGSREPKSRDRLYDADSRCACSARVGYLHLRRRLLQERRLVRPTSRQRWPPGLLRVRARDASRAASSTLTPVRIQISHTLRSRDAAFDVARRAGTNPDGGECYPTRHAVCIHGCSALT